MECRRTIHITPTVVSKIGLREVSILVIIHRVSIKISVEEEEEDRLFGKINVH